VGFREKERDVENIAEELVEVRSHGRSEIQFITGGGKSIILFEGSQDSPACPSDKGRVKPY
jgi:hypothetical protein